MSKKLPDHTHCWYCAKAIMPRQDPENKIRTFCSDECGSEHKRIQEKSRKTQRNKQIISLIPIVIVIGWFVLRTYIFPFG